MEKKITITLTVDVDFLKEYFKTKSQKDALFQCKWAIDGIANEVFADWSDELDKRDLLT